MVGRPIDYGVGAFSTLTSMKQSFHPDVNDQLSTVFEHVQSNRFGRVRAWANKLDSVQIAFDNGHANFAIDRRVAKSTLNLLNHK
jgi:hypothetical protein